MEEFQPSKMAERLCVCPRYLAAFQPKQVPHFFTDVLVVGSGLAGLRAALESEPSVSVLVLTKADDQEAGRRDPRMVHADSDATGREAMRALLPRVQQMPHIGIWEKTFAIDLLTDAGKCCGALVWNRQHGKTLIWAKQTILATGGAGQIYRETTNPDVATGDGLAMAYRAGAEVRDLEFMQFHPTVLYVAGSSRHLVTEAVRGEGAWLVDGEGRRFMPEYDPRAELAPPDTVSRAIAAQMEKTRHPNVYLDLSHLDPQHVRQWFPGIAALCAQFGLDITCERLPVRPGAHSMRGGVTVDRAGRTTLPRLWAVGEVASTGLDGPEGLASDRLSEAAADGTVAGREASAEAAGPDDAFRALPLENPPRNAGGELLDIADIRNSLKSLMWRACGVCRDATGLAEAAESVGRWCRYVLSREFSTPIGWELQNMLVVAGLTIEAATRRTETRGTHFRTDYPETDDQHWARRIAFQGNLTRLDEPRPPEPAEIPIAREPRLLARARHGKAITVEFRGGYWDGKALRTDSDDQEEALLAMACYEMAHHGAIGAECAGMSDDAVLFARLHGWAAAREAGLQGEHRYQVTERAETADEITVRLGLAGKA